MEFEDSESFFPLISEENILMTPPRESESGNFVGRDSLLYFCMKINYMYLVSFFWAFIEFLQIS